MLLRVLSKYLGATVLFQKMRLSAVMRGKSKNQLKADLIGKLKGL